MAGEQSPGTGDITFLERPITAWSPAELARRRAVLPQEAVAGFALTAREVVTMGRLPHGRPEHDAAVIAEAMHAVDIESLAARDYRHLSGGEKQRVQLARVLAQLHEAEPGLLLLDEPTSALDLGHQQELVRLLRRIAAQGRAVLAVLHDLNLAAACADRITLLVDGRQLTTGTPEQVLTPSTIHRAWGVPCEVRTDADHGGPQIRLRYPSRQSVEPALG